MTNIARLTFEFIDKRKRSNKDKKGFKLKTQKLDRHDSSGMKIANGSEKCRFPIWVTTQSKSWQPPFYNLRHLLSSRSSPEMISCHIHYSRLPYISF